MIRRMIRHIKRWNAWRKYNCNGKIHKILVLVGLSKSPTMATVILAEEYNQMKGKQEQWDAIDAGNLTTAIRNKCSEVHMD